MNQRLQSGFSLVEMSIVLIIIGALAGSLITPMRDTLLHAKRGSTKEQLLVLREAMHGYLIAHGHLPCPVSLSADNGQSALSDSNTKSCTSYHGGFPAVELGVLGERSAEGLLLDPWGNPIRYALTSADHKVLGKLGVADWVNAQELAGIGADNSLADLQLCRTTSVGDCPKQDVVAADIVWVVYSTGMHSIPGPVEKENQDNDNQFVFKPYSINTEEAFDDQIIWASRSELIYWLLKAHHLP